ncbi:MAG: SCO family protein [Vulcanimicrobiaceae bacterium]
MAHAEASLETVPQRTLERTLLRFLALVGPGLAIFLALVACARNVPRSELHGTVLDPPRPAAQFTLPATYGGTFSLASARGHLVVLYFGFTHCKDVCPQTLAHISEAIKKARFPSARSIFVTIDPERDTAVAEREFITRSAVRAIGVTGSREQLQPIWRAYGVAAQPQKDDIAHSDYIYLIDGDGDLREILHADVPIADLSHDMRFLSP